MGLRFRKSINLGGGFRVNLSKSGIGYSWGTKGFRVTKTARGTTRATATIPGTGISYVEEAANRTCRNTVAPPKIISFRKKNNIRIITSVVVTVAIIIGITKFFSGHFIVTEDSMQSEYSPSQLLYLQGHPQIYDNFSDAEAFYTSVKDSRIKVTDISSYAAIQRNLKSIYDDNVLLYLIQGSTNTETIGTVVINLFTPDLDRDMDIDIAIEILTQYLPDDFLQYYKLDRSYKYENEGTTIYTYACRLNESGIEHHNESAPQYSYYYCFRVIKYADGKHWKLETDYAAYGDKSIGWIENYADPWDIDISPYFET